ncbi:LPXTG cell wall anchor domain-containing protein [Streptosporangium sp. KLBMP 9127]|nr:LPXTG cell wall anchor domain-containing protein [Streptosporangium sp. KLBMP 9127]
MTHPVRRAGTALVALLAGLFAILALAPAASAAAPPDANTVLSSWKGEDPLFVQDGASLSASQQTEVRTALKDAKSKIYMVALPDGTVPNDQVAAYITSLGTALAGAGRPDATVAVLDGTTLFAASGALKSGAAGRIANLSTSSNQDVVAVTQDFANRIDKATSGDSRGALKTGSQAGGSGSSAGVLVGILVLALAGGGGLFLYSRKKKKQREVREAAELAAVKQTVEEDVTMFGEEITSLDTDVKMLGEGGGHLTEWQQALDSYEKAKTELNAVKRPDDVRNVTTTLEDGRYALAVVKAKVNEQPVPERRAPCFFNPQHGPSIRDVRWSPPGGAPREVPACAADAHSVESGHDPQMREVMVNGERRPYYDAGPAYQPYAYGYYGGFGDVMSMMLIGTMMGSMMSGGFGGMGYDQGMADMGGDAGGGDFGDFGGGGGGFGDFGGGDFGGGDW